MFTYTDLTGYEAKQQQAVTKSEVDNGLLMNGKNRRGGGEDGERRCP